MAIDNIWVFAQADRTARRHRPRSNCSPRPARLGGNVSAFVGGDGGAVAAALGEHGAAKVYATGDLGGNAAGRRRSRRRCRP